MNKLFYPLLIIIMCLPGCAKNIRNVSAALPPSASLIVGRIDTVPALWKYVLHEEGSGTEDSIDVAGMGFGYTKGTRLQHRGYIFKVARSGAYSLRLRKMMQGDDVYDTILRFDVPEGKLVYLATVKVVIDQVSEPSLRRYETSKRTGMMFRYHFVRMDEEDTLQHFADQYPETYAAYKDKIVRIPVSSKPALMAELPAWHPTAETNLLQAFFCSAIPYDKKMAENLILSEIRPSE